MKTHPSLGLRLFVLGTWVLTLVGAFTLAKLLVWHILKVTS